MRRQQHRHATQIDGSHDDFIHHISHPDYFPHCCIASEASNASISQYHWVRLFFQQTKQKQWSKSENEKILLKANTLCSAHTSEQRKSIISVQQPAKTCVYWTTDKIKTSGSNPRHAYIHVVYSDVTTSTARRRSSHTHMPVINNRQMD